MNFGHYIHGSKKEYSILSLKILIIDLWMQLQGLVQYAEIFYENLLISKASPT